jgi:hypothetical protein
MRKLFIGFCVLSIGASIYAWENTCPYIDPNAPAFSGAVKFGIKTSAQLGLITPIAGDMYQNSDDSYAIYIASGTGIGQFYCCYDRTKGPTLP